MRTLISGGTALIWNGTGHEIVEDAAVAVEGNRIVYAGARAGLGEFAAETTIDARGKVVTPGLINTHIHANVQATAIFSLDTGRRDMYNSAYLAYQPVRGQGGAGLTPEEQASMAEFSLAGVLRRGSTTVVEMGIVASQPDILAEAVGQVGIRCYTGPGFRSANYAFDQQGRLHYEWDEEAGWRGLERAVAFHRKWDGAFNGRLRAMLIPRNADTCTPELMVAAYRRARELGCIMQIHTAQHLIEYQEIMRRHGKTPVQFLHDLGILGPHMTVGHCVYVTGHSATATPGNRDLEILAETGTSVAHSPLVFARNGRILETFARYLRHGVNMTVATDTFPQDLISEMRLGLYLAKVLEGDYAAVTAEDMFHAATIGGARALQRDDLGRLAPGALADVVLWDLNNLRIGPYFDPVKALVHCATGDDVDTVLVDGRVVVEGGRVLGARTEPELVEVAQRIAEKICRHRWPDARIPTRA
ncbi:MAG TPA: chlorohydrolase family protein [Bacillota bacterium]